MNQTVLFSDLLLFFLYFLLFLFFICVHTHTHNDEVVRSVPLLHGLSLFFTVALALAYCQWCI